MQNHLIWFQYLNKWFIIQKKNLYVITNYLYKNWRFFKHKNIKKNPIVQHKFLQSCISFFFLSILLQQNCGFFLATMPINCISVSLSHEESYKNTAVLLFIRCVLSTGRTIFPFNQISLFFVMFTRIIYIFFNKIIFIYMVISELYLSCK